MKPRVHWCRYWQGWHAYHHVGTCTWNLWDCEWRAALDAANHHKCDG